MQRFGRVFRQSPLTVNAVTTFLVAFPIACTIIVGSSYLAKRPRSA